MRPPSAGAVQRVCAALQKGPAAPQCGCWMWATANRPYPAPLRAALPGGQLVGLGSSPPPTLREANRCLSPLPDEAAQMVQGNVRRHALAPTCSFQAGELQFSLLARARLREARQNVE